MCTCLTQVERVGVVVDPLHNGPNELAIIPVRTPLSQPGQMPVIERYIFRDALIAFLAALLVFTATIWVTQALREVDLLTTKGQTLLVFLTLTLLTIPSLVMILTPVAAFAAVIFTLNRLNSDSELVVMNSAGLSPARVLRPFALLGLIATIVVALMSVWIMPQSFRTIRDLVSKIRTDVLTRIVREGQFISLEKGFVFHYRERGSDGSLRGIFIQDRREPQRINTYIAENGRTIEQNDQNYLILEKGSVQRQSPGDRDPAIVQFERYAIDLAQFASEAATTYKPREMLTSELFNFDRRNPALRAAAGRYRVELHDRLASPLYAFAFALIAFAALGQPRTTRQGRGLAIFQAVGTVAAVRIAGFGVSALAARSAWAIILIYGIPLLAMALACLTALKPGWTSGLSPWKARPLRAATSPA